ncbi:MAG: transporter substrate-binding domain-containing protein [Clostridiales Family XIII bacterium]|jgi:signal transduction histidine kinase/CheY-like chemotaxis protein/HPt (histidine-containing phosphotransfer) domain-containing protein|nr:transporter substrate-binding domain-containing protein [Clostridiales Family XIII bacterium]
MGTQQKPYRKTQDRLLRGIAASMLVLVLLSALFTVAYAGEKVDTADTFRDLPGITQAEINEIEAVLKDREFFSYGMLGSSRCFVREDGTIGGFAKLFCDRMTEFFGVPFELEMFEGDGLDAALHAGTVDFSGEFMIGGDDEGLIVTSTVGERALETVRLKGATNLEDIASLRPVQYGIRGTTGVSGRALLENPPDYDFDVVIVSEKDEILKMIRSGELDVFMADASFIDSFKPYQDIKIDAFDPLTFKSVGVATSKELLAPIISAINGYLQNGGLAELNDFYMEGDMDYNREVFLQNLTEDERDWYDEHLASGTPIKLAVSYSNYPVNFYNEKEGHYAGIAVDVLDSITEMTGIQFEIANEPDTTWTEILEMLDSNEVSFVAELLRTPEREGKYIFGEPYTSDPYMLISRSDTPSISINQVLYANVGLIKDTAYETMFQEWFPGNRNTTEYTDLYEAFDALENDEVDFVMSNEKGMLIVSNYMERSGFKPNLTFEYTSESQFGFNKEDAVLPAVMGKAQELVDTAGIDSEWRNMTFDYEKEAAQRQTWYMVGICALLAFVIILMFALMRHRRQHEERLEALVTERTAALEEQTRATEAANSAKSDFLANMSHEMRTPLNAVIGLSELSLTQDYSQEETQGNLEKIYNSGVTLLGLVNDILDLSKIESGKFELVPVDYDIPSIINDTVTLNIIRIGSKPIEFKLEIDESLPARLYGDELRVKQIFNNLLSNAFKYTKEGEVTWAMYCEKDEEDPGKLWLCAEVRDSGIGIKPENLSTVFGEYSQVDMKANRKIEGTGLGLAITKHMVEAMGGEITVESVYGEGSTFKVRIAQGWLTDDTIGKQVVENLRAFRYADRKRDRNASFVRAFIPYAKVLVVDDVATNLDVARGLFKPYGMQVDTVMSGQAAIDLIKNREVEYSAIFMDHMMPEMDGIEATRIIKNEIGTDYAKNIPVIALTANALVGNDEMFLSNGFQDFLSKPIDIIKLDEAINRWVRDKALEKELAAKGEKVGEGAGADAAESAYSGYFEGKSAQGVNLAEGLARFGGDEEAYLSVIRSYIKNTPELAEKAKGVTRENLCDYAIVVHGLKGASRNVGAAALGDKAEELETAAKADDYTFVAHSNEGFLERVANVVGALKQLVDEADASSAKEKKPAPDADALEELLEAARVFDIDGADEAMAKLECYSYETGGDLIIWLREELDRAGFAKVAARLEEELKKSA